jgi:uncharacterized protein (DUF952 family)
MIYKILCVREWQQAQSAGSFEGSAIDRQDGYIHFSTAGQVAETAARHFAGRDNLLLLSVDDREIAAALKWEPSRGGALFPHLYAPLPLSAVMKVDVLPWDGARHVFPPGLQ